MIDKIVFLGLAFSFSLLLLSLASYLEAKEREKQQDIIAKKVADELERRQDEKEQKDAFKDRK